MLRRFHKSSERYISDLRRNLKNILFAADADDGGKLLYLPCARVLAFERSIERLNEDVALLSGIYVF